MAETPARYCSNCGQELSPEDRFCPTCGRPVHRAAHVPTPEADAPVPPSPQQAQRTAPPPQASFSIKEMVTLGVAAAVFTLLTSTWEWGKLPGLLFYAILSPMMGSVILSIIKVYLSGAAVGGRRLGILGILTALWRFGALPGETKKSLLLAGLRSSAGVGLVSSIISVSTVVGAVVFQEARPPDAPGSDPGGGVETTDLFPGGGVETTASCGHHSLAAEELEATMVRRGLAA